MSKFYEKFPKIKYNFDGNSNRNVSVFTDVMFRFIISQKIKENVYSYYEITVPDEETLTTIADKYYGDPEYHWVIAMTNNIVDPLFDWPMGYRDFQKYIKNKYGTIAAAQTTVRHYTRTIKRTTSNNFVDTLQFEIGQDEYDATPAYTFNEFNLANGEAISEEVTTGTVSFYDYEKEINENKRIIKLIKKEYLPEILGEFDNLVVEKNPSIKSKYKRII